MCRIYKIVYLFSLMICFINTPANSSSISRRIDQLGEVLLYQSASFDGSTIAVLPFDSGEEEIGIAVAELLLVYVGGQSSLQLVERSSLRAIFQERTLSGDGSSALLEDYVIPADYLIIGTVNRGFGNYNITARVVDVASSEIVSSASVELGSADFIKAVEDLFSEKSRARESLFRSILLPGWGQSYAGSSSHSILFSTLCGLAATGTVITGVRSRSYHSDYKEYWERGQYPDRIRLERERIMDSLSLSSDEDGRLRADEIYEDILESRYDDYRRSRDVFQRVFIGTGVLWGVNALDAFVLGRQADKKFELYFSGNPVVGSYKTAVAFKF